MKKIKKLGKVSRDTALAEHLREVRSVTKVRKVDFDYQFTKLALLMYYADIAYDEGLTNRFVTPKGLVNREPEYTLFSCLLYELYRISWTTVLIRNEYLRCKSVALYKTFRNEYILHSGIVDPPSDIVPAMHYVTAAYAIPLNWEMRKRRKQIEDLLKDPTLALTTVYGQLKEALLEDFPERSDELYNLIASAPPLTYERMLEDRMSEEKAGDLSSKECIKHLFKELSVREIKDT